MSHTRSGSLDSIRVGEDNLVESGDVVVLGIRADLDKSSLEGELSDLRCNNDLGDDIHLTHECGSEYQQRQCLLPLRLSHQPVA